MTAGSNHNLSRAIGDFDVEALRSIQRMTDRHVKSSLEKIGSDNALRAASTPDDFIDLTWIDQFGALGDELWDAGIGVVDDLFRVRFGSPLAPTRTLQTKALNAVEESKVAYLGLLRALIQKNAFSLRDEPIMGEFMQGSVVQYGDVRNMLIRLGGGSRDPHVKVYGGVTTGVHMRDFLSESGINTNQKIWLYGYEEQPRRTFNGHLQMDGLVFEEWNDNGLVISPQDRWLKRNYYAPGDHWGCACVVAPYFPNFGEEFEI